MLEAEETSNGSGHRSVSYEFIAKSSNGRMGLSESSHVGSNPAFAAFFLENTGT